MSSSPAWARPLVAPPTALVAASPSLPRPAAADAMLVMGWNPREVTEADRGFPKELPVVIEAANGDWTAPVDYAHGQLFSAPSSGACRRASRCSCSGACTRRLSR